MFDYRSYLNSIISLLTGINNNLVALDDKVFQIVKICLIGLFVCVGLWSISKGWRYKV